MRGTLVLRQGVEGLRSHRLRTLLTTLGMIFGVAAVIAMLSIGEGAKREALAQFQRLGIDNVLVLHQPLAEGAPGAARNPAGLTLEDARATAEILPLARRVVPLRLRDHEVQYGRERIKATIVGTTPEFTEAMPLRLRRGRFFREPEVDALARVCVLGAGVAHELFPLEDPLGRRVKLDRDWYTVIGVMAATGPVAAEDTGGALRDQDRDVYIPVTAALRRFDRTDDDSELSRIVVQAAADAGVEPTAHAVRGVIERRHRGVADYRIVVPQELIRQRQATARIFNLVMGAIAGISLLVGGIGIMNIMLANVLERTREIGVRRAMGARTRDVLGQFLLEAVAVSFVGGTLGIALGFALTRVVAATAGWPTVVVPSSVLLAFGVSTLVGIVFGYYPARRAARLSPIEALRYE
jgi:putative ABC transport system permease protein